MSTSATNSDDLIIPKVLKREVVFNEFGKLTKETLALADGSEYAYYTMGTKTEGVLILATTPNGDYVTLEEYRHPVGQVLLGLPGGFIETHEDPLIAAQRELLEETGYSAKAFEILGQACPLPGLLDQSTIYVRAHDAVFTHPPQLEPAEILRTRLLSHEELVKMIKAGTPMDASLCAAFFLKTLD